MSYLLKHWRGQLSLGQSFWMNYFLVALIVNVVSSVASSGSGHPVTLARLTFYFLAASSLLLIWQAVGVWRSAQQFARQATESNESQSLARLAQAVVIFAVCFRASIFAGMHGNYNELYQIGFTKDPLASYRITLVDNNSKILIDGGLGFGAFDEFKKLATENSGISGVILNSNGGRIIEGRLIAELVEEWRLDTYVENSCFSACTHIFAAGDKRKITASASIGFHKYSASFTNLISSDDLITMERKDREYFKRRGIEATFVDNMYSEAHENLWLPSHQELIASKLVHEVVPPSEIRSDASGTDKSFVETTIVTRELADAIKKFDTDAYRTMIAKVENARQNGTSLIDLQVLVDQHVTAIGMRVMPKASDDALIDWSRALIDILSHAKKVSPKKCLQVILPEVYGGTNAASFTPAHVLNRSQKAMGNIILSSMSDDVPAVDPLAGQTDIEAVVAQMGELASYLAGENINTEEDMALYCDSIIALYQHTTGLETAAAGNLLRFLFQAAAEEETSQEEIAETD